MMDLQLVIIFTYIICNLTTSDQILKEVPVTQQLRQSNTPHIDPYTGQNQTVQLGETAIITCKIYNVANRSVSWVRLPEGHILIVDGETFTQDTRISSVISRHNHVWSIRIQQVQPHDRGQYECQVSTEKKLSLVFQLHVVIPKVQIRGGPDIFIHDGSPAQLECVVTEFILPPQSVVWHRDGQLLDTTLYTGLAHHVDTSVNRSLVSSVSDLLTSLSSTLKIDPVSRNDAGNYTCKIGELTPVQAVLHVVDKLGEHKLFMVNAGDSYNVQALLILIVLSLLLQ